MKNLILIAALLGASTTALAEGASAQASAPASAEASAPVPLDACAALPAKLVFDAGRVILERDGEQWKITKGDNPNPRDFLYPDDEKRILRFVYWSQKSYHCIDTGRRAKH